MKKLAVCLFCLLCLPLFVIAQTSSFDSLIDFSVTLRELATAANKGTMVSGQKILLLTGSVGSVNITSGEGEPFSADIELIGGEWIGLEEVKIYRILLLFRGDRFAPLFAEEETLPLVRNGIKLLISGNSVGIRNDTARVGKLGTVLVGNVRIID